MSGNLVNILNPSGDSKNHQMFALDPLVSVILKLISCGSIWSLKWKHLSILSYTVLWVYCSWRYDWRV